MLKSSQSTDRQSSIQEMECRNDPSDAVLTESCEETSSRASAIEAAYTQSAGASEQLVDGHRYVFPSAEDYESDSTGATGDNLPVPETTGQDWPITSPPDGSLGSCEEDIYSLDSGGVGRASFTSILLQAKKGLVSKVKSLGRPKMEQEYLSVYLSSVQGLLNLRTHFEETDGFDCIDLRTSLEKKIERVKVFQSMCELERENPYFSEHLEFREPLMRALGLQGSMVSQELETLILAADELNYLLNDDLYANDQQNKSASIAEVETLSDHNDNHVPPLSTSVASLSDSEDEDDDLSETPPFLKWVGLDNRAEEGAPVKRLAAENLYTIMEDIDRAMCRRKEISYLCTEEITLNDLERTISHRYTIVSGNQASNPPNIQPQRVSARENEGFRRQDATISQSDDEMIPATQKTAIDNSTQKLVQITKNFMGLFIPSGYNHRVAHKVWGALQTICTDVAWTSRAVGRNTRPLYVISPSGTENFQDAGVQQIFHSFERCSDCQLGVPYRSMDAALTHLKRNHLRDSTLAGLRSWSWRWITTESQLRIGMHYKQQLRLLHICLTYVEVLHNRAQKIRSGVISEEGAETAKYQLPNDLVDCFETTAIFLMQAAASVAAVKDDMQQWHYVPGSLDDDIESPIVARTLARLGELGQAAQASMTRAEKTLALSDPEMDTTSVGSAGPEFLVSVICQNLQNRQLLEGFDMDVNELYQSYASKLVRRLSP